MATFAHIINPVRAPAGSELDIVQPATFATVKRALGEAEGKVQVDFLSAQFPEDHPVIPSWVKKTPDLERSLADLGSFAKPRRLPVLRDILDRAMQASDADYIIFSNADICLMPSFYLVLNEYAEKGYDAFAINRRRIPARFAGETRMELLYAEAGEKHPGYDTLVFRRSLYEKFVLGNVCTGIPRFDTILIHNFYAFAENFRLFTGKHLTFHIGMTLCKRWGDNDQYAFNEKEYAMVRRKLYPHFRIENFPGANLPFLRRHFKWFLNPTFSYPMMFRLDLSQLSRPRRKREKKEICGLQNRWCEFGSRFINFDDEY
ncbi:MAG TPA: hypothetical protein VFU15_15435 [Bacteroidia bacterium]|nr:hypothetical protein [Bacteroidia bacterium]